MNIGFRRRRNEKLRVERELRVELTRCKDVFATLKKRILKSSNNFKHRNSKARNGAAIET